MKTKNFLKKEDRNRLNIFKGITTLLILLIIPCYAWSTVGDWTHSTTEEGVSVLYTITSEPPISGYPGTVSVGWSEGNSYTMCIDRSQEGTITIPQYPKIRKQSQWQSQLQ